jgi:hypothetical protein
VQAESVQRGTSAEVLVISKDYSKTPAPGDQNVCGCCQGNKLDFTVSQVLAER